MKKQRFTGPLGPWINKHLALRRSLGFIYKAAEYNLDEFDQYLKENFPQCKTISREMVIGFLDSKPQNSPLTRSQHITSLRQFCRFMFQFDTDTYIPEKRLLKHAKPEVEPHIFTEEEIRQLIYQAKNMNVRDKLLPHTYAAIIGLLWVTGMRIGEVVHLKIEDLDVIEGIITVQQTKFFKSRIIPLSPSSNQALVCYKQQRAIAGYSEEPKAPLFYNHRGKPCITATTPRTIKELIIRTGIKTPSGKIPRVHDIRHSFATRWILDFYRNNKDPTVYLPVLATYMGHANIANTQVYLHPSIELLNLASQQLQSYLNSTSGEKNDEGQ